MLQLDYYSSRRSGRVGSGSFLMESIILTPRRLLDVTTAGLNKKTEGRWLLFKKANGEC